MTLPGSSVRRKGTVRIIIRAALSIGLLFIGLLAFLWWQAGRDAGYAARVLWHRDSGTSDFHWRHSVAVEPSPLATPWPAAPDCPRVASAFGTGEGVDGMHSALDVSGTLALVVIHHGMIQCDWYGNGGAPDKPAAAFSISKTVLSLILARAVDDGTITNLNASITGFLPRLAARDPRFSNITLANLLDMRSGIGFSEQVDFPWVNQDAPSVYYASDLAHTVLERPKIESNPGQFVYNDYAPNLIGLALQRATGKPIAVATQQLWTAIGAQDPAQWSVDEHGFAYHESGFVATARDIARVGQLVLDGGDVDGHMVAPASFIARSLDPVGRETVTNFAGVDVGYRNGWWVLQRGSTGDADLVAMGDHGQVMLVSPATDTVIVRMGVDGYPDNNITIAGHLQRIARAVSDQ